MSDIYETVNGLEPATRETIMRMWLQYVETALWASADDAGNPLDCNYSLADLSPETSAGMLSDCYAFLSACWGDTWDDFEIDLSDIEPEQLGHDYWLTRNRHGAGFWDRGLGEVGDKLTTLAHADDEVILYVGDDGLIYAS